MKVKCTKCGKVVQRTKEAIQKAAAKAGYASLESYLKDYICGECRGEPVPSKSNKRTQSDKSDKIVKVKTRSFEDEDDIEQDEEEIDQSFEIEDEIEEDTSEIDELEEELDRLIDEEDEEEEVEL
jgi:hypothetical protein